MEKITYKKLISALAYEYGIKKYYIALQEHKMSAKTAGIKKKVKNGDKLTYDDMRKLINVQLFSDVIAYKRGKPLSKQTANFDLNSTLKKI
ncbi:MAG: hypothetical protein AABY22_27085 [Nanoarchaeota archaeon]